MNKRQTPETEVHLMDRIQELERHAKELESQVYYEQMKPYKIECEKGRLIEEVEFLK